MGKNINLLGQKISEARTKLKISQRELARLAHVDSGEISRIEAGLRQKPNVLILNKIAKVLNLDFKDLSNLAGYNNEDINLNSSSNQNDDQVENFTKFFFAVLKDINKRRANDTECQKIIMNLIDRLENPDLYEKPTTKKDVIIILKEITSILTPNLEKFDKAKYPDININVNSKKQS